MVSDSGKRKIGVVWRNGRVVGESCHIACNGDYVTPKDEITHLIWRYRLANRKKRRVALRLKEKKQFSVFARVNRFIVEWAPTADVDKAIRAAFAKGFSSRDEFDSSLKSVGLSPTYNVRGEVKAEAAGDES